MKYSKQRELVCNTVMEHKTHLTADQIYGILKKENPSLSLGTVYRNLNLLCHNGMIRKIGMPGKGDRFDGNLKQHDHMICEQCGNLYDIKLECMDHLAEHIKETTGFTMASYELIVTGVCEKCGTSYQ